jgi:hypothetical protein
MHQTACAGYRRTTNSMRGPLDAWLQARDTDYICVQLRPSVTFAAPPVEVCEALNVQHVHLVNEQHSRHQLSNTCSNNNTLQPSTHIHFVYNHCVNK